jgi:hypothetical protein
MSVNKKQSLMYLSFKWLDRHIEFHSTLFLWTLKFENVRYERDSVFIQNTQIWFDKFGIRMTLLLCPHLPSDLARFITTYIENESSSQFQV